MATFLIKIAVKERSEPLELRVQTDDVLEAVQAAKKYIENKKLKAYVKEAWLLMYKIPERKGKK